MTDISIAVREALLCTDPRQKVVLTRKLVRQRRAGALPDLYTVLMPDSPGRPAKPVLVAPNQMPKRGKGGSERARIAMIHALAHIEFVAIDLALDIVGRFGAEMPKAFVDDWLSVAADEAIHFLLLSRRLEALGSYYGALPAHAGLWEAATKTRHDVTARLAIVPMVLEARGLDVTPATISRFEENGDMRSAAILGRIYSDEIRHVGFGVKWFRIQCLTQGCDVIEEWQKLVVKYFRGALKPPFNDSARYAAGLTTEFYYRLAHTA